MCGAEDVVRAAQERRDPQTPATQPADRVCHSVGAGVRGGAVGRCERRGDGADDGGHRAGPSSTGSGRAAPAARWSVWRAARMSCAAIGRDGAVKRAWTV